MTLLTNEPSKSLHGDEPLALLVVEPERVPQLLLHGLHVRILHQEGCAELAELSKLDLTWWKVRLKRLLFTLDNDVHHCTAVRICSTLFSILSIDIENIRSVLCFCANWTIISHQIRLHQPVTKIMMAFEKWLISQIVTWWIGQVVNWH